MEQFQWETQIRSLQERESCARLYGPDRSDVTLVFLSAGPGWGKTAVVTRLLEKQNPAYLSLRRRPLPHRFSRERLIILDDFQALPPQAEGRLQDILRRSPPGQLFLLLSRGPVPEYLFPYEAAGAMLQLGEAELALDMDCLCQLAQLYGLDLSGHQLQRLWDETGGCPPAVRLLLAALSAGQPFRQQTVEAMRAKMGAYMEEAALRPLPPAAQKLLLELSLFDRFDQALADMLAEEEAACVKLDQIWRTSGLIRPDGPLWTVHDQRFLLPYLRQKLRAGPPKRLQALHLAAGRWCAARQDLPGALYHCQQADSREELLGLLIQTVRLRPGAEACRELWGCAGLLRDADVLQSPDLICAMSLLRSMTLEPEESERWYQALNRYLQRMDRGDEDYRRVRGLRSYLDLCLPHRETADLPKVIVSADRLLRSKALVLPEADVTGGLPSIIRGARDLSPWVSGAREPCGDLRGPAERVFGRAGTGLGELALAEGLLEQGGDISGRFPALAALQARLKAEGTPELEFVRTALLARALCAAGSLSSAEALLLQYRAEAARANTPRILSNLDAMRCRLSLLRDGTYAAAWAAQQPPGEDVFLWADGYRCLTIARCCLRDQRYHAALLLLSRLLDYFQRSGRTLDRLETLILTAVCRFRMDCEDWRDYLAQALELGARYGYVSVFTREGAALLPLLERGGHKNINTAYRERVLSGAVTQAGYYGRYLAPFCAPISPLTQKERTVLRLICQNKSNEEIGRFMNIKLPTVKTHVHNLLTKLNVSSRNQVRGAAERLKLL